VLPRLAAVGGLVDAIAGANVAANVPLTRADVNDVGIGGRQRDRPDARRRLIVEGGLPRHAAVDGLPYPARCRRHVVNQRITRHTNRAARPTSRGGPDLPYLDALEGTIRLRLVSRAKRHATDDKHRTSNEKPQGQTYETHDGWSFHQCSVGLGN